jgi:translation initiation factor IF-1
MLLSVAGALFAMITLSACESSSPPRPMQTIEDTVEASATVESVDVLNRLMTIKTEAGDLVTLEVGPEVQNLVQVRQGDRVVVRYREAIGARISNDAAGQPVSIDVDTDRARLGQRPSARASATTNVPVTINSVDTRSNLVTFSGPDGLVRSITVATPEGRDFIRQLKKGDTVVLSFTEALAVSVEPAK